MLKCHRWKCPKDNVLYRKIVEHKRTSKFLLGLNKNLDEVRGKVMGTKPFLKFAMRKAGKDDGWSTFVSNVEKICSSRPSN